MSDPNMSRFQLRLERIEQSQAMMAAIEDSLGRPSRLGRSVRAFLRSVAITFLAMILLKVAILLQIGAGAYEARLASLRTGKSIDEIGAYVLGLDPLTRGVAGWISDTVDGRA